MQFYYDRLSEINQEIYKLWCLDVMCSDSYGDRRYSLIRQLHALESRLFETRQTNTPYSQLITDKLSKKVRHSLTTFPPKKLIG